MIEVEVKARADHRKIKKLLEGMGAQAIGIEKHHDTYYNAPHRDFAKTDEALRIRLRNGEAVLTYKGKKLDSVSKTRNEFETPVDGENARSILLELGFVETAVVKKTREVFEFDDLTIDLDSVDGLGEFIEVEIVADSDVDHHRARLFGFLAKLGIREDESIRRSYMELLM
ncbi:MAG: class IV adenylate cyclase [Methanosarcinaceae archaeon]|nr:class IV adenylate cyclase [Methanosarcinaceae archaeon]